MQGTAPAKLLLVILAIYQVNAVKTAAVFAVTWLAGHCEHIKGKCDPNVIDQWDHQSFTINGLWPSGQFNKQQYGRFDLNLLRDSQFFEDMKTYWPPQPQRGGKPYFLWELQWKKHGKSFGDIYLQLFPQNYSYFDNQRNEKLQLDYFQTNLKLYKRFNLIKINTDLVKKQQLAKRMKISEESFYFICTEKGILREIRICVDLDRGAETFDCNRDNRNCNDVITLKDWAGQKSDAQRQREVRYKRVPDQERQRLQAERQRREQDEMLAHWNINKEKQSQNKPLSDEQRAEINFYEKQVSPQELVFEERTGIIILSGLLVIFSTCLCLVQETIILSELLFIVFITLCIVHIKNESKKQNKSFIINKDPNIQLPSINSTRQDQQIKFHQP